VRRFFLLVTAFAVLGAAVASGAPGAWASAPAKANTLDSVTVTGNPGEKPVLSFAAPVAVKSSIVNLITPGTGDQARKGSTIKFDYVIVNGRPGQEIESSYGRMPNAMPLDVKQAEPALVKRLIGTSVGSRVLIAIAPKDGLARAASGAGIKKNDTLLFLFDIRESTVPLERATGEAVAPVAGLPTVTLAASGEPKVKIASDVTPPTTLVAQPLIRGAGKTVEAGQTLSVRYTGSVWRTGKTFDSTWSGSPVNVPIGRGNVVAGWDEGLVGQTVGSQVLLVIPPDQGYGANGNPQIGVTGTDVMVFVVDILSAT
jgi:FKBP-type peptidyl-prolyl cis-trans isomerase